MSHQVGLGDLPIAHLIQKMSTNDFITYRALEVSGPGKCSIVRRQLREPRKTQVQLRVLACGICRGDLELYRGSGQASIYPRVPGQEIVGIIEAVGPGVVGWRVGQRVGCGSFGGNCGFCPACRRGDAIHCDRLIEIGTSIDGGLAERVLVEATSLILLPSEPSAARLAPLLGAGVVAFQTLRSGIAKAGDIVAIHGIGRVGSLALQFARRMGFQTIAISRHPGNAKIALQSGAHAYISCQTQDATQVLFSLGGAQAIVSTSPHSSSSIDLLAGLANRGTLALVQKGAFEPLIFSADALCTGSRSLRGMRFGTPWDLEETIRFSLANKIECVPEMIAFDEIPELFAREAETSSHLCYVTEPTSGDGQSPSRSSTI